ncbi:hypothetical protein DFH08DRAFT_1051186 [Mycena albidolilacea]|uniref:Uncharacterized protein n=1 Tax=Mycena albidolilacea TaxID=1033008 RepID=A0AAD7EAT5_9AGAR|nr:hypothetical protein DFH08DRAFT_1051186 [Mycena albidolilacea]
MSNVLPTPGPLADPELPVLDNELYAICPDCKGEKSVWMFKPKNRRILSRTVTAPAAIQMVIAPNTPILGHPPPPTALVSTQLLDSEAPQSLLDQLRAATHLRRSHGTPRHYVDSEIPAIEVYEQLNPIFHAALGWNMTVQDTAQVLRRGKCGLDGLLEFMTYFVHQRGVREQDFAAKIKQILDAIKFLTPASTSNNGFRG